MTWRRIALRLDIDISDALSGLSAFAGNSILCAEAVGRRASADMEAFAKLNRPWTDRTGNARRTISGVCRRDSSSLSVGVEGHMPYSVFLELGHGFRYSILAPTVHHFAPDVLLAFADGLNSMK